MADSPSRHYFATCGGYVMQLTLDGTPRITELPGVLDAESQPIPAPPCAMCNRIHMMVEITEAAKKVLDSDDFTVLADIFSGRRKENVRDGQGERS